MNLPEGSNRAKAAPETREVCTAVGCVTVKGSYYDDSVSSLENMHKRTEKGSIHVDIRLLVSTGVESV